MNFVQAVSSGFSNYVNFSGRAVRSEYWYWFLFAIIGSVVTAAVDTLIGFPVTNAIFGLAIILPGLAVTVRRLHDINKSGWFIFLGLIPLVGMIILLIWFCQKGDDGPNRFGPAPLADLGTMSRRQVA